MLYLVIMSCLLCHCLLLRLQVCIY